MKYCTGCKKDKSLDEYGKDSTRSDGLRFRCKKCHNARQKRVRERPETKKREAVYQRKRAQTKKGKYSVNPS